MKARFTFERNTAGQLTFCDGRGFGVGATLEEAFADWCVSAKNLSRALHAHTGEYAPDWSEYMALLDELFPDLAGTGTPH